MLDALSKVMAEINDNNEYTDFTKAKKLIADINKELEEKKSNYSGPKYNDVNETIKSLEAIIEVREKLNKEVIKQGALLDEIEKGAENVSNEDDNKKKDELPVTETKKKCVSCIII